MPLRSFDFHKYWLKRKPNLKWNCNTIFTRIICIYCPICIQFATEDTSKTLLNNHNFRGNWRSEGRSLLRAVCEFLLVLSTLIVEFWMKFQMRNSYLMMLNVWAFRENRRRKSGLFFWTSGEITYTRAPWNIMGFWK